MFSSEFKAKALKVIEECDGSCIKASRKLGIVSAKTLWRWRTDAQKPPRKRYAHLSARQKRSVAELLDRGEAVSALADRFGVSITTVCNIRNEHRSKGALSFKDRREAVDIPQASIDDMPDDIEELKRRCAELEIDNAILAQTIEILKKDPGVDPSELSNREKTMAIDALRDRFAVTDLCARLGIARSSCYYAHAAAKRPDPHASARARVRDVFEGSGMTFGSERIWHALKVGDDGREPLRISEKVIRRIMREEGLAVIYNKRRRSYSSYKGEISEHPGDRVRRNFHAGAPNELRLTDITQFTLPGFKCYLSAIVDCFDGKIVSYRLSKLPDAELANSMLCEAIEVLTPGDHPVLHSDCGCHYRWPEWIRICKENGIIRSMSKKACSPDNAACEGFFGRLKNEFFHYRDWSEATFEGFARKLDGYIKFYNGQRKKKSLGWMSPQDYRLSLGFAA
ncbi:IS3 family transposase [Adlercreutzia sp. R21]|uniref:IS3 family transposase n=1 Tax=Adlercreutzia wanghongyangiae TaxID=3111451 RepID=UPI002DBBD2BA|nr:IS3 family transposase [Adlercreutzia sp. R21]MEC4183260.1 IS3 family transposase [Adlercreutzia sp. R21]